MSARLPKAIALAAVLALSGTAHAGGTRTAVVVGVPIFGAPAPVFVPPVVTMPIYPAAPNLAATIIAPPVAPVPFAPGFVGAPPVLFNPIGPVGPPLIGAPLVGQPLIAPMPVMAPGAPVLVAPPVQTFGPQLIIIQGSGWR